MAYDPRQYFETLQSRTRPDAVQQLAMADEEMRRGGKPLGIRQGGAAGGSPPAANTNNPSVPVPRTGMEDFLARTEGMSRPELLQSEALWGGARNLAESTKMPFQDAFKYLVERQSGYGLTPAEWSDIARQAMKYGIR